MTGPLRADSAARRRLVAGESPESVSQAWPAVGDAVSVDGAALREVTFVLEAEDGDEAMLHLNAVTDGHRSDIRPALFEPVPGTRRRVLALLLPEGLTSSYRFVVLPVVPRDAGATREGWLRIHAAGRPDERNPRRLPNPLGAWSSVLVLPGAREEPAWSESAPVVRSVATVELASATLLLPVGGEHPELLVLFDAAFWHRVGLREALERVGAAPAAVVLVPSGTQDERAALLPRPDEVARLLRTRVLPEVAERIGTTPPECTTVAGQSYGGLAAAGVVALHPELARRAIVQSGSFHFRAGSKARPPQTDPGDLVRAVRRMPSNALRGRRFDLQAGTEEGGMLAQAGAFAEAARAAGGEVTTAPWIGGHDYAWWRHGLLAALRASDPRDIG